MTRARPTRGTDSITLAKPNTTSVHIQRPKPAPLRKAGLQDIPATNLSASGKPLISPVPSQAELRSNPHRAGSADAFRIPSLSSFSGARSPVDGEQ